MIREERRKKRKKKNILSIILGVLIILALAAVIVVSVFKVKKVEVEGNQLYDFLQNAWDDNDSITFNIVGKPSINEYNGVRTPQIIIEDVEVINTSGNDEDDDW